MVDSTEKLIYPVMLSTSSITYYMPADELYDSLLNKHLKLGYGGRDRMLHEIKTKYQNTTVKQIQASVELCESCQQKKSA